MDRIQYIEASPTNDFVRPIEETKEQQLNSESGIINKIELSQEFSVQTKNCKEEIKDESKETPKNIDEDVKLEEFQEEI